MARHASVQGEKTSHAKAQARELGLCGCVRVVYLEQWLQVFIGEVFLVRLEGGQQPDCEGGCGTQVRIRIFILRAVGKDSRVDFC